MTVKQAQMEDMLRSVATSGVDKSQLRAGPQDQDNEGTGSLTKSSQHVGDTPKVQTSTL